MNAGAVLIGIAAALLTVVYVAAPFRRHTDAAPPALDALIEHWIAQAHASGAAPSTSPPAGPTHFCHHCGRRIQPDHRFCPACGTRLQED